jgi:hypothetical protein
VGSLLGPQLTAASDRGGGEQGRGPLRLRWDPPGEFLGIPATGKPLAMTEITIWRIAEGKIVERWIAANALDAVSQLGARVVPPTDTDE